MQKYIRIKDGLICMVWGCQSTLELKRAYFKWFEGANAYFGDGGLIWIQKDFTLVDWGCTITFETKKGLFEWIKDAKAYLRTSGLFWVQKYLTLVDQGYKGTFDCKRVSLNELWVQGTFESKRAYLSIKGFDLSGSRVQRHFFRERILILVQMHLT